MLLQCNCECAHYSYREGYCKIPDPHFDVIEVLLDVDRLFPDLNLKLFAFAGGSIDFEWLELEEIKKFYEALL